MKNNLKGFLIGAGIGLIVGVVKNYEKLEYNGIRNQVIFLTLLGALLGYLIGNGIKEKN